jgi:ribonuclease PH
VDANVVVAEPDRLVEVQATGEHDTFARADLDRMLDLALAGTRQIFAAQHAALGR